MSAKLDQQFENWFEVFRQFVPEAVVVHYREEFGHYTAYALVTTGEERKEVEHARSIILDESGNQPGFDLYIITSRYVDRSKPLLRGTKKVKGLKKTR